MQTNPYSSTQFTPDTSVPPIEIVRLTEESWLFTKAIGSLFSEMLKDQIAKFERVLDIACGPGDWALEVAFNYPHLEVVGTDFNENMVNYAKARGRAQRLKNVFFQAMSWTESFDLPDDTFDFINGRLLVLLLPRTLWPTVIQDAFRILRPGGILRLIDADTILTSSWAVDTIHHWTLQVLQRTGFGFSPTGRTLGMSPVLPHLVRKAGFVQVHSQPYSIDFSSGTDNWGILYRNIEMACTSLMPQIVAMKIATQEEFDKVFRKVHIDMMSDDFYGLWPFFSLTGVKP